MYKAHWMQNEMGFGNTQREKDETALCLTDTTYIDRGLYLYLNIVVCLQVLIIGPLSTPPFLLTSELGNGKTPGAGTSWKEISISFVV